MMLVDPSIRFSPYLRANLKLFLRRLETDEGEIGSGLALATSDTLLSLSAVIVPGCGWGLGRKGRGRYSTYLL